MGSQPRIVKVEVRAGTRLTMPPGLSHHSAQPVNSDQQYDEAVQWLASDGPLPVLQTLPAPATNGIDRNLKLFTHDRLDLVVKYRFFKTLSEGTPAKEIEEMYIRHILCRTGGIEPGSSTKVSIGMYVAAARDLFRSIEANGFRKEKPVVVDQWGRLRNGAHRLACATVLGVPVGVAGVRKEFPVRPWGIDWFLANGFSKKYVIGLLDEVNAITGYSNPV